MKNVIKNKNLFIAERLLEITQQTRVVFVNNRLFLEKKSIPELSNKELVESLKRLEERGAVRFQDEEDKFDTKNIKYIALSFNKDKLLEFIEIAKDKVFKITTQHKKDLEYVLKALDSVLQPKFLNKQIEFSEIGNKYIEISEWIADYSGIIKVLYELEADVEWKDTKRPYFLGASEQPKKLEILDRSTLEQLNNEVRQFVIKPYQKRISLLLDKNPETEWRITKDMFNKKLKEYKERQAEINEEMQRYTDADENYYLTANITLNLAKKALEIFKSSEINEKRQLLNFLLQNCRLEGKKLNFELKTPFNAVLEANKCSNLLRGQDSNLQPSAYT